MRFYPDYFEDTQLQALREIASLSHYLVTFVIKTSSITPTKAEETLIHLRSVQLIKQSTLEYGSCHALQEYVVFGNKKKFQDWYFRL